MSVRGLLEAEKKAASLQRRLDTSFNKQLKELRQEIRKVEYLLGDRRAASMWANSPADPSRIQQLRSMLNETERLYLEAGNSEAARIFKRRMEKQLRQRLTNLKANELEVMMRVQAHKATAEKQMLRTLTTIKREGAARELYMQSRTVGGFISGVGRGFMQDLVTLETKAAGSKTLGEYMTNLYMQYEQGLKDVFVKGIIRGDSYEQMENNLMRITDITKGKARLLVRTEANAIFNESVREVIDANPLVKGYRFRAVLDRRTSEICQKMDGKYIPKEEVEPGVNFPPLHPNCRSTVTTVLVSEDEKEDLVQRYTKNRQNQWVPVPLGMTYPEFKRRMSEFAEATPGVSRRVDVSNIITLKGQSEAVKYLLERRKSVYEQVLPGVDVEKFVKGKLKKLIDNCQLRIRVPDTGVLEKILDEGFKNQIEVGTSRGVLDEELRKRISGRLFGYDETQASASDFEIYGYLHDDIDVDLNDIEVSVYGNIVVELKKENLKDRTTFTVGDSLRLLTIGNEFEDGGREADPARLVRPSKITDISSTSMTVKDISRLYLYENRTPETVEEFKRLFPFARYIEAQYHGGVKASDIDSVTFEWPEADWMWINEPKDLEMTKELFDKLKEKGIKVKARRPVRREGSTTVFKVIEIDSYEEFIQSLK